MSSLEDLLLSLFDFLKTDYIKTFTKIQMKQKDTYLIKSKLLCMPTSMLLCIQEAC